MTTHNCPQCGIPHRNGWLYEHTCGHNGCQHICTQAIYADTGPNEATITAYEKLFTQKLPSGDNPIHG